MKKWPFGLAVLLLALGAAVAGSGAGIASPVATYTDDDAPAFMAAPAGTLVLEQGCLYVPTEVDACPSSMKRKSPGTLTRAS
ncbi:MAG: hypothetical protein ACK4UY_15795 [Dietzia sp.]